MVKYVWNEKFWNIVVQIVPDCRKIDLNLSLKVAPISTVSKFWPVLIITTSQFKYYFGDCVFTQKLIITFSSYFFLSVSTYWCLYIIFSEKYVVYVCDINFTCVILSRLSRSDKFLLQLLMWHKGKHWLYILQNIFAFLHSHQTCSSELLSWWKVFKPKK